MNEIATFFFLHTTLLCDKENRNFNSKSHHNNTLHFSAFNMHNK